MDDREPVNESGDKTEDNDDSQDSVQANPARIGNQTLPPLRQVSPEDQELLSGISEAASSTASSTRNRNINQLCDSFQSSRHLRISTNCSLLADALLSPRHYSRLSNESGKNFSAIGLQDLAPVRQGQSGHRDLPSDTEASSSQDQNVIHPEEASSRNALASNRRHQKVSSLPDSEHSNVSSLDSNERGGSLSSESRGSDCASPLQSSSVRETEQIPQPGKKARKSFKSKEANTSSATGSFKTGIRSTSEHSDASSVESNERGASLLGESRASDCASPLQSSATLYVLGLGVRARKTVASSRKYSKTNTALAKRSAETSMGSISAETELSESESGESFESKPSPSAAEGTLDDSSFNAEAPGARIAGQEAGTSRKRGRESSSPSENEDSRRQRKIPAGEINAEARGKSIADQEAETSRKRERESSSSSENEDARRQRKIPAGERPLNEESSFSKAERTLDNSPISSGTSTGSEQSDAAEPHLDIGEREPSESEHQPLISADASNADPFAFEKVTRRNLLNIFENFEDKNGDGLVVLQPSMSDYFDRFEEDMEPADLAWLWNELRLYLAARQEKWLEISKSLRGMELEIRKAYENFMRILVQLIIATLSPCSTLDYHVIMMNYRNFAFFVAEVQEFYNENEAELIGLERTSRSYRFFNKINLNCQDMKCVFRRFLKYILTFHPDILSIYWGELLDDDQAFLREEETD